MGGFDGFKLTPRQLVDGIQYLQVFCLERLKVLVELLMPRI